MRATIARIAKTVGIWTATLLLAGMSLMAGSLKFTQARAWDAHFVGWGYATWFRPVVGAGEITSGALVLLPVTAAYGASLMAIIMTGAVATHIVHGEFGRVISPLVLFTLSSVVFFVRRPRFRAWWVRDGIRGTVRS